MIVRLLSRNIDQFNLMPRQKHSIISKLALCKNYEKECAPEGRVSEEETGKVALRRSYSEPQLSKVDHCNHKARRVTNIVVNIILLSHYMFRHLTLFCMLSRSVCIETIKT